MYRSYKEKLLDPEWQKKRFQILDRDKGTCQLCQDITTELQVHHKTYTYGKEPWDYPDDNLITYCKHCHAVVTICDKFNPLLITKHPGRFPNVYLVGLLKEKTGNLYSIVLFAYSELTGQLVIEASFIDTMFYQMERMIQIYKSNAQNSHD